MSCAASGRTRPVRAPATSYDDFALPHAAGGAQYSGHTRMIGVTVLRRRAAEVIERIRKANKRARFVREVRQAEAEYAAGSWTEFEDAEALIRDLKS